MTISVYLLHDVADLGRTGQVVTVRQAYARNFLIPKGYAAVATPALIAKSKQAVIQAAATRDHAAAVAQQAAATLTGQTVRLAARANPQGKLFAAVKAEQVKMAILAQHGLRLPPNTVLEPPQFKTLGDHPARLTLADHLIEFTIHLDHADRQ